MIEILYTPTFIKSYSKLEKYIQEETKEKIELFKNATNHKSLTVHKLKGKLKGRYSFSINYNHRIVFKYGDNKNEVFFLNIGDHKIYDI